MGVTSTLVPLDSSGTSAPVGGAAARAGLQVPNWRLLRGRAAQSPIDDTIRRQLGDIFFPNDAVSVDISHSSPLPFANELRSMFSVYAEKQVCVGETMFVISCILNGNADAVQFLTLEDVAAGFEAVCLAFASRTPHIVVADNVRPANSCRRFPAQRPLFSGIRAQHSQHSLYLRLNFACFCTKFSS
jgi:hypothetical protein